MPTDPVNDRQRLVESLTGGKPIDWAVAEANATNDEDRSWLRALRDLERMSAFHHSLQHGADAAVVLAGSDEPQQRWGDLLLLERWGAGANADVYRAWDTRLQREVAVKLLHARGDDDALAALAEARALARVRDPHVVQIHDVATHDGRAGIEMEFLRGATLEAEIARRGALPAHEVAQIGAQIAHALAAAHAARVLHGDVKPANISLEANARAVLSDFGLGRPADGAGASRPFAGTPMFMSPQRLAGATATAADDVYALGVTLRWALTGAAPFAADSLEALRAAATRGEVQPLTSAGSAAEPAGLVAALVATIEQAMAPEAAARPASAAAFAAALEAAARVPVAAPAHGAAWGGRAGLAAIAIVIGALAVGAFWIARQKAAPATPPVTAATAGYDVSATLLRHGVKGDVRLAEGDRVKPGDKLSLEVHGTQALYVYVMDADDRGETYLLFPQPIFDTKNPLPADRTLVLPGARAGAASAWTVTSRGGHEHFLIVASPAPVAELESDIAKLPAPVPGKAIEYARVGAASVELLRGVGGVSELRAIRAPVTQRPRTNASFEKIRALAGQEQGVRGVWVRQVTLSNPLR